MSTKRFNTRVAKNEGHRNILDVLRAFLIAGEPKVARWLVDTWNAEREAIKYQEIQDAILRGQLSGEYLNQWQRDYTALVNEKLVPVWTQAFDLAAASLKVLQAHGFVFDSTWPEVKRWIAQRGTDLAVNLSKAQHEALKQLIMKAALMGEFGPDELSRMIRPLIGLVPREAIAVQRYYAALRVDGMSQERALKKATSYAGKVHRHRAYRIARTELAAAFNQGAYEGIKQAQSLGLIGKTQKRWLTAADERVCPICMPLDEVEVKEQEAFPGGFFLPPAHPHCRCSIAYEVVEIPVIGSLERGIIKL